MPKYTYTPKFPALSWDILLGRPVRIAKFEGDKINWSIKGNRRKFEIWDARYDRLIAREEVVEKKWKMPVAWQLRRVDGGVVLPDICFLKKSPEHIRYWGENKQRVTMHLNVTKRLFEGNGFEVVHRDFWSKLEVKAESDKDTLLMSAWWCFLYWHRMQQEREG